MSFMQVAAQVQANKNQAHCATKANPGQYPALGTTATEAADRPASISDHVSESEAWMTDIEIKLQNIEDALFGPRPEGSSEGLSTQTGLSPRLSMLPDRLKDICRRLEIISINLK